MRDLSIPFSDREVLADVEGALGCGFGTLVGGGVADDDEARVGLLVQGEADVVEAALGFVVDSDRTGLVALEGDSAKRGGPRNDGKRGALDVDERGVGGCLAEVVDQVAGDRDGTGS